MRRVTIVESLSAKIEGDAAPCEFTTHLLFGQHAANDRCASIFKLATLTKNMAPDL
jgi:hypothetical protein